MHARWVGDGNWWVESFIHTGGRWFIRSIIAAAIALWTVTCFRPRLHAWRRPAGHFALASIAGVGIVGLLKVLTNVHCPWDLTGFGGAFPEIPLCAHHPIGMRAGHCFPAAHASSGYALVALYFAARERSRSLARAGLITGLVCGIIFGVAQQSRGAHFASHDLWSALIVWVAAASVYVFAFDAQLHGSPTYGAGRAKQAFSQS